MYIPLQGEEEEVEEEVVEERLWSTSLIILYKMPF